MRALSFSQPWLWCIFHAGKCIENRSWPPPQHMIGERFALHAAKSWDDDAVGFLLGHGIDSFPSRHEMYPTSCIVGTAVIDYVRTSSSAFPPEVRFWCFDERKDGKQNYAWALADRQLFATPIPAKGKQGLWTLTADQEALVRDAFVSKTLRGVA